MSHTFPTRPSVRGRGRTENRTNSTRLPPTRSSTSTTPAGRGTMDISRGRGTFDTYNSRPYLGAQSSGYGAAFSSYDESEPSSADQRGQYSGGFTVFAPNQERRQRINEMATKETEAFQSFKEANSRKMFNYVGTVGGGDLSQNQVRTRQANAVRAQKVHRQMRQSELREERKRREEEEVLAKRAEARRKAEQNRTNMDRTAPADEVRRKREAFLQQLESGKTPGL